MVLGFLKASYQRVKEAFKSKASLLAGKIRSLFGAKIDETTLDQLEKLLYEADLGASLARELTDVAKHTFRKNPSLTADELIEALKVEMERQLEASTQKRGKSPEKGEPFTVLIVGVNGNGKTTSIAKIAKRAQNEGKKVLVAAADTYRAAGATQLEIWAERLGVEVVKGSQGGDAAAVAFDAATAAKARGADLLLIDTAGRLHTKSGLMVELEKLSRVTQKVIPTAPHETWLVIDATTGQNAIDQATIFNAHTPLTGLVLTKLDGSAKGGIALRISKELGIPIVFIGIGESEEDLLPFDPKAYISALFE